MRKFFLAAAVAAAALLGSSSRSEAAFQVNVYDDGVLQSGITAFVLPGGNSLIFGGSTTHFSITNGSGLSNNTGTQGGSNLDLSNSSQINTTFGGTGGTHTIRIEITQDGWVAPVGTPLTLTSSAGGSFAYLAGTNPNAVQSVSTTYQGFLDNTNTLFGQPAAGSTPIQTASASLGSAGTAPLVFSPGVSGNNLVPGGTPFSMTDVLTFTFTLSAGSGQTSANVSASTVASVPAPAGVVLALTALPVLGVGGWIRRRTQRQLAA